MKTYRVLSRVRHDGTLYDEGVDIELEEAVAAPLLEGGAIDGPHVSPEDIRRAIRGLDPENPKLWTKGGKTPQVAAISAEVGVPVTAAQRDAAWADVQKEQG